jgi:hypothetical protein
VREVIAAAVEAAGYALLTAVAVWLLMLHA